MSIVKLHNPTRFGEIVIGTSKESVPINISFSAAIIPQAKIVITSGCDVINEYTVGNGLTLSNSNMDGDFIINERDYMEFSNRSDLKISMSLFNEDREDLFINLKVVKTFFA